MEWAVCDRGGLVVGHTSDSVIACLRKQQGEELEKLICTPACYFLEKGKLVRQRE